MNYTAWERKNLRLHRYRSGNRAMAVWYSPPSGRPLAVMVHGISGDHSGLVPLAAELAARYRLALVELPGHGRSSPLAVMTADALQEWFMDTLAAIETDHGHANLVVAHSFGCLAVIGAEMLHSKKVVLLNPVPTPSDMYARYSRLVMKSSYFLAHMYNWRLFVLMRSKVLTKINDKAARQRVAWVGWQARPSARQIVYQSRLVDIIFDASLYDRPPKDSVALVVCGLSDTTAKQRDSLDMEAVFGNVPVVLLKGGHLLPIESPARVARVIIDRVLY